jgi:glycosyltransferase involved in cell wall biosynthesis
VSAPRLSVFVIAQNEAERIGPALDSVRFADEIVVVDGGSTDDTAALARERGARVEVRPWPGSFGVQLEGALGETRGEWVFRLDADETVTEELASEMRGALARSDAPDGFRVRRKNYFLGKWIRHGGWWPDPQLRLVRRAKASIRGAPGHETVYVDGRVEDLAGAITHDTNPTISAAIARVERYSTYLASERAGRRRIRTWHLVAHPFAAFFRKYVVQGSFLDGPHGFLIAAIHAYTKLATYAKAWELQRVAERSRPGASER